MREETSTAHAKDLFVKALQGQNFSPKTVRAYGDGLAQFTAGFERRYSKGNTMGMVMDWVYYQSGRCAGWAVYSLQDATLQ